MRRNKIVALMESVFVKKNNIKLDFNGIILYISKMINNGAIV